MSQGQDQFDITWKEGDPIDSPVGEMISLDPLILGQKATYKLLIGAIVPRPIAFVSTLSPEGIGNLAPFSFFNGVSSNPPALMIAITRKKTELRRIPSEISKLRANLLSI